MSRLRPMWMLSHWAGYNLPEDGESCVDSSGDTHAVEVNHRTKRSASTPRQFFWFEKDFRKLQKQSRGVKFFFFAFVFFKYSLLLRCRLVSDTVHSTQKQHDSEQKYTGPWSWMTWSFKVLPNTKITNHVKVFLDLLTYGKCRPGGCFLHPSTEQRKISIGGMQFRNDSTRTHRMWN